MPHWAQKVYTVSRPTCMPSLTEICAYKKMTIHSSSSSTYSHFSSNLRYYSVLSPITQYLTHHLPHSWYSHDSRVYSSLAPWHHLDNGRRTREGLQLLPWHKDYSGLTIIDAQGIPCSNSTRTIFDDWMLVWALIMLQLWYHDEEIDRHRLCVCVCPTANTLCPHNRKALEFVAVYAQNKVHKHHAQRISWLLVAISNVTLIAYCRLGQTL